MKNTAYIALLFVWGLIACTGPTKKAEESVISTDSVSTQASVKSSKDTGRMAAYYDSLRKYFPLTHKLIFADSILSFHNPSNTVGKIYLPTVKDKAYKKQVYALVKATIESELSQFCKFVLEDVEQQYLDDGDSSLFEARPVKIYYTRDFTGIAYLCRELPYAGVHSNYFYETVNMKNGKEIYGHEYFNLVTKNDTDRFVILINKYLQPKGGKIVGFSGDVNFLIQQDSISFFFSSYEAGSFADGTPYVTIPKKEVEPFIRK